VNSTDVNFCLFLNMEYSGTQRIFIVTVLYNKKDVIVEICIRKEFCRNVVSVYKLVMLDFISV
jgi:hypothetical protein